MKQFDLIVFDSTAVLQLLYSCAYSRAAAKGIPIVFLANDVISAYNEWYDAERQFNPGL